MMIGLTWILRKLYVAAEKYGADSACASIKRPYSSGKVRNKIIFETEEVLKSAAEKYEKHEIPRFCFVWNKIYKRSELERQKLNFKEGVTFEDIYFTARFLYFSHLMVTVPGITYYYRVNPKSITRSSTDNQRIDRLAAQAGFIKFAREHRIVCDEKYCMKRKTTYSFLGVPIIKIYEWETLKKYYLFGLIPIFEKKVV